MESVFSFVVGLLTAALSLLGFVQQHPELPQASRDQANQISSFSGPTTLAVNTTGTWTAQVSDPDNDRMRYVVRWGDEPSPGDVAHPLNWPSLGFATEYFSPTFYHSYRQAGTYLIRLSVVDDFDANHVTEKTMTVQVNAATLSASPASGSVPLTVRFSAPGLVNESFYKVDFGDGQTSPANSFNCFERQCIMDHTYTASGTYTAKLIRRCGDTESCSTSEWTITSTTITVR